MARKFKTPITIDELGSASSQALAANVDGDSQNRVNIDAGGKITWGSGSATGDTTLYRSAADTLKTDDAFTATSLAITGQFTLPTSDGSADQVITTNGSGTLSWADVAGGATVSDTAPSSPSVGDIWFESDTGDVFVYYDSAWIDVGGTSVANISTSDTAPSSPANGDIWFETDTGKTFVYYDDGSSQQWVEIGAASSSASGSAGAVQFADGNGAFSSDATNFYWDDANNRLGIGTTTPAQALEVDGQVVIGAGDDITPDGTGNGHLMIDGNGYSSFFSMDGTGTWIGNNSNGRSMILATDETARLTVSGTGLVGIGTTSPAEELHILKDQDGDLTQVLIENLDQRLRIGAYYEAGVNQYSKIQSVNDSGSQGERLALNPDGGNVGIGTTTPETSLSIVAANALGSTFTGSVDGEGLRVQSNYTAGNYTSLVEGSYTDTSSFPHARIGAMYDGGGSNLAFGTSNNYSTGITNTAMFIDSDGNVGVGTTSPPGHLQVASQNRAVSVLDTGTNNFAELGFTSLGGDAPAFGYLSGYDIHLRTGTSRGGLDTRLFVKRDGLVGIGTTSPAEKLTVAGDVLMLDTNPTLNIKDSDSTGASNGSIVFRDSADTVLGRIQMNGNDDMGIQAVGAASTMYLWAYGAWRMSMVSSGLRPYVDNSFDLGATSKRFDDVYATNGTIQTSDERDKTDVADIDYGLTFVNSLRPVTYRWDDRSGYTGTRTHMGFIAQEVETALGDDAATRAVWVDSPAGEYKNADTGEMELGVERQSLRYEEMIAPMVKAVQELSALNTAQQTTIEALEGRIAALEAG